VRDAAERDLRDVAERLAEDEGKNRVGVETVIAAWIQTTPESLRPALPQQMESMGLDPADYAHLLG
jgi:predicted oxidoreductase